MQKLLVLGFTWVTACLMGMNALISNGYAFEGGDKIGGGGDASEARVNEIRSDIVRWIENGGSKGLRLPIDLPLEEYDQKMLAILEAQKVIIGFVENDQSPEEELRVMVNGQPKTCRGFISRIDNEPHILCHIDRFRKSSDPEQYRLIHHEYAGLAGVEKNEGAASDYKISNQITDFLREETVLRLAVKNDLNKKVEIMDLVGQYTLKSGYPECPQTLKFTALRDTVVYEQNLRLGIKLGLVKEKYHFTGATDHTGRIWREIINTTIVNNKTIRVEEKITSAFPMFVVNVPAGKTQGAVREFTPTENGLTYKRYNIKTPDDTRTCHYIK
ncbi:hypothetical protein ACJVC5_11490 [Peredibacter sp. HCB2-198]|uniref:hypothetical protein n=1 Tax=Peredibacter sp. HCB2-198 TaxID=3383025 RepID=UPI0038B4D980